MCVRNESQILTKSQRTTRSFTVECCLDLILEVVHGLWAKANLNTGLSENLCHLPAGNASPLCSLPKENFTENVEPDSSGELLSVVDMGAAMISCHGL